MRKFLCLLVCMACSSALAQKKMGLANQPGGYGMAGCGLGSILFGETDDRFQQVLAGTTNALYLHQTFAMSSGTSNCAPTASGEKSVAVAKFVSGNQVALANDIARGQGESIEALASLMNCESKELGQTLKPNYSNIFAPSFDSTQISNQIFKNVNESSRAKQICPDLS